jgi:hypothetical protein
MKFLSIVLVAAFAAICFSIANVKGNPPTGASGDEHVPPQMVIDYGQGRQKHRDSHHGVMEPVGLAVGQPVTITLEFSPKRAGDSVLVSALDGGSIDPEGPVVIPANGKVSFHFQPARTPGLYRLLVQGADQYQLQLYAVDPNRPVKHPHGN